MPRTKLQEKVDRERKLNLNIVVGHLMMYMRAQSIKESDVSKRLGIPDSTFRNMIRRPMNSWRIREIEEVCKAVGCPPAEVYTALAARK